MDNITLERQADGSYKSVTPQEPPKADLHQDKPIDGKAVLKSIGMTDEQIALLTAKKDTANLEASGFATTIDKVTGFEVWDIPLGAAAAGGVVAVLGTELIDGMLVKQNAMIRGLVKLIGAGVIFKFGSKLIGNKAAGATALLMAFDGLKNDIIPAPFNYVTTLANKATGVVTKAGLGWTGGPGPTRNNVQAQADLVLTTAQKMSMR